MLSQGVLTLGGDVSFVCFLGFLHLFPVSFGDAGDLSNAFGLRPYVYFLCFLLLCDDLYRGWFVGGCHMVGGPVCRCLVMVAGVAL